MNQLMERLSSRTVDELGRIILPSELRKDGWSTGSTVSMYHADDNTVIMQLIEKYQVPICTICKKTEREIAINGIDICRDCVDKINNIKTDY